MKSVFERRRFGWLDRGDRGREIAYNASGNPTWVVAHGGRLLGVRATDGSVIPLPERPLEELPDDAWVYVAGLPARRSR
jgi:hypothetical protein